MTTRNAKAGMMLNFTTGAQEFDRSARALAFGHLADLAAPIVTNFRSDMFHDALWLDKYMVGSDLAFFYAVRKYGTTIGTEELFTDGDTRFHVHVWVHDGEARMEVTPLN